MYILITIILQTLLFLNCQEKKKNIIVDTFPSIPFNIERPIMTIPDSLGGDELIGKIIVKLEIDSSGKVLTYELMSMDLKDKANRIMINYRYSEDQIDKKIIKYINWIEKYIDNLVISKSSKFEKTEELEKYSLLFPIQFKNK